jgi:hypothetical protein
MSNGKSELRGLTSRIVIVFVLTLIQLVANSTSAWSEADSLSHAADPNAFRLFLAPTSVTLPANHGTIQLAEVVVPTVNYGVIDELVVRGGVTPFAVSSHILYYGLAGLQIFDYDGFTGVGGVAVTNATGDARAWESALYGFGVIGYTTNLFGIYGGVGGGYSGKRESSTAIFLLGAEYAITAHNKLITENWLLGETAGNAFSFGIRSYGTLLSFDLGVMGITDPHSIKVTTVVPWVALSYHFDVSE